MSSSATHFTLWNSEKGHGSKVKEKFFSHSHACSCFTELHYRCRVSLRQLNSLLPPQTDLREKGKKTLLIVTCSVPMTSQNTPCYCIFAVFFQPRPTEGLVRVYRTSSMTVTPPVTCFHKTRVLVYGERLQLTPLTWLDLMRTDGSLSVGRHIKQLCQRSVRWVLCKIRLRVYSEMTFQSSLEVLRMQS